MFINIIKEMKTIVVVVLFIALPSAAAMEPNLKQQDGPISIDANHQEFDIANNTITFSGNVVIQQDGLDVTADKVVISNVQNGNEQEIVAYGSPIHLKQTLENGNVIEGQSSQIHYNVKQSQVILLGNAKLKQQDNIISGERIIYKVNERQVIAEGSDQSRVKTTIIPNQIKETNK